MSISISQNANKNYLAKIVKISSLEKHPNADRLQVTSVDFQNVIVGLDAKVGDYYVYFPIESQINEEFLSFTNSFREKELNTDKEKSGFFEKNRRVRAVKLRGEKSMGYMVPLEHVEAFSKVNLKEFEGQRFDTIRDICFVKKYVVKKKYPSQSSKQGKKPRISRLVDGQVHLHIDTDHFKTNAYKVKPSDLISITYKLHGTSFWVSNILVKKRLNLFEKFLKFLRISIIDTEYDCVYGSRKVVKNEYETKQKEGFYGHDIWGDIAEEVKELVPKGYTLYGECVGFLKNGKPIQKDYDYGCQEGKHKIYIDRITITNADGTVYNLPTVDCNEFCEKNGLYYVPLFYYGYAKDWNPDLDLEEKWTEEFVKSLEAVYTEKRCNLCLNNVPAEGVVIRKESSPYAFKAYKLKSFAFYEHESKLLDKCEENIEDNQ
jgi:RNA ligase (TIGR02306 family)